MGRNKYSTLVLLALLKCVVSQSAPNINDFKVAAGKLTANLYKSFGLKDADNMVFSPISVAAGLAMMAEGASGKTLAAFQNVGLTDKSREQFNYVIDSLQSKSGRQPGVEDLRMINSIWIPIEEKMPSAFHSTLKNRYFAQTRAADFSKGEKVAEAVNARVEKETNGLIKNLLSKESVTPDLKLMLMNALYFNGKWLYRFDKEDTQVADFINPSGQKVKVNMMNSNVSIRAGHACCNVKATVAVLPYSPEERFSLAIIVPDEPLGYKEVEEQLFADPSTLAKVVRRLTVKDIELSLPRFVIEKTAGLKEALESMGLGMLFTSEAELPNIIYKQNAVLSSALHKAKIIVNEEGTEAAGVSVFQITPLMADFDRTTEVRANRTFLYTIWDNDNDIPLFIGRVANPSPAEETQSGGRKTRRQISFKEAKRHFRRAESEQESTTPNPESEDAVDKGITGPANWWKPTPHPSVLISLEKRPNVAVAAVESIPQSPVRPQTVVKKPTEVVETEAVPLSLNGPPIFTGVPSFLRPSSQIGHVFSGEKVALGAPLSPAGLLNFPGLAVREPLKKQQSERDPVQFPNPEP